MICLGNEQRSFCHFWDASKNCILDFFVDYDGNSISSKWFMPTVVDIMVIWVKFTHSSHFSLLIPRMPMFTLAISCLTTSNLAWFMDLTFQVPMQYCTLQHQTLLLSPVPSNTGCCFCFGSIPSFFLDMEKQTGFKWEKGYIKFVYCHPAYLTYMQSTSEKCWAGRSTSWKKIAGKNINNLRYADDTILMANVKKK